MDLWISFLVWGGGGGGAEASLVAMRKSQLQTNAGSHFARRERVGRRELNGSIVVTASCTHHSRRYFTNVSSSFALTAVALYLHGCSSSFDVAWFNLGLGLSCSTFHALNWHRCFLWWSVAFKTLAVRLRFNSSCVGGFFFGFDCLFLKEGPSN